MFKKIFLKLEGGKENLSEVLGKLSYTKNEYNVFYHKSDAQYFLQCFQKKQYFLKKLQKPVLRAH